MSLRHTVCLHVVPTDHVGQLRHVGWEDPKAEQFSSEEDCNAIQWEEFSLA